MTNDEAEIRVGTVALGNYDRHKRRKRRDLESRVCGLQKKTPDSLTLGRGRECGDR